MTVDDLMSALVIVLRALSLVPPFYFLWESYKDRDTEDIRVRRMRRVFLALCASLFLATLSSLIGRITSLFGIADAGAILTMFIFFSSIVLMLESYAMGEYRRLKDTTSRITSLPPSPDENLFAAQPALVGAEARENEV